jgi:UDP-N-acetylmuramoyl-L-alanyl-D-glutamate--2,6-diaminopimelate ligase
VNADTGVEDDRPPAGPTTGAQVGVGPPLRSSCPLVGPSARPAGSRFATMSPRTTVTATLSALSARLDGAERRGPDPMLVDATHDSRQAGPDWLYCAVVGSRTDGHDHAREAVARGATAVLVERFLHLDVAQVRVPSVRASMGPAAAEIHGRPSERLKIVGVTGTNGKTTLTYLLEGAFGAAALGTGVVGTIESRIHGSPIPVVRTTPEGTDLQRLLAAMVVRGVDAVAMEVSSHGLDQRRVDGTRFDVAVFTNLSQDHLDWHHTMDAYLAAKARLFTPALSERAVVDVDDEYGARMLERVSIPVVTVGSGAKADARVLEEHVDLDGGRARVRWAGRDLQITTRLLGGFNLRNAVLAVVAAIEAGIAPEDACLGVAGCDGVPGRLERVDDGRGPRVLIDYAHTPDAIGAVLGALRSLVGDDSRIVLVVGAGGDRDPTKRAPMGAAAAAADMVVLTSDNPRSEPPEQILEVLAAGARSAVAAGAPARVEVEPDRRAAIARALEAAKPRDLVVVAGKGHETVQEIGGRTIPFDDREVARSLLAAKVRA